MRSFIARLLVTAFGLWVAEEVLSGVYFDSTTALLTAALLLGLVNAVVRPVVFFLTLPITFLTLGLFILVINGCMVFLVSWIMSSFHIDNLGTAVLASLIVGLTSWAANRFIGAESKAKR
jgi:putative membrane protein